MEKRGDLLASRGLQLVTCLFDATRKQVKRVGIESAALVGAVQSRKIVGTTMTGPVIVDAWPGADPTFSRALFAPAGHFLGFLHHSSAEPRGSMVVSSQRRRMRWPRGFLLWNPLARAPSISSMSPGSSDPWQTGRHRVIVALSCWLPSSTDWGLASHGQVRARIGRLFTAPFLG